VLGRAVLLDIADFSRNAAAPEFGRYGVCNVLYTGVPGDFKNRILRQALDRAFTPGTLRPRARVCHPVSR
jgi:hypothetical protein